MFFIINYLYYTSYTVELIRSLQGLYGAYLREFVALHYERHPESMRGESGFALRAVTPFLGYIGRCLAVLFLLGISCFNLPNMTPN